MWRCVLACGCVLLLGCSARSASLAQPVPALAFLTCADCVQNDTMRARFDKALTALGRPKDYAILDADSLFENDPRRGYGTPTILYRNVDLFGMPEPPATKNAPT